MRISDWSSDVCSSDLNPAYSSSKAAVNALTKNAALQFGRYNIRCNAITPGLVLSPVARAQMSQAQLDMVQRHVLLPRMSRPQDIADAVVFQIGSASCRERVCHSV